MEVSVLAIQSYGYIHGPTDMSPGAIGSRARILSGLMLVEAGIIPKENLIAVFPQGYRPSDTSEKTPLCDSMKQYFASRQESFGIPVYAEARGWSTFNDVQNIYRIVEDLGYKTAQIHFVSDQEHLKRVQLMWDYTRPDGWGAEFHPAVLHHLPLFERTIREPVARLVYQQRLKKMFTTSE